MERDNPSSRSFQIAELNAAGIKEKSSLFQVLKSFNRPPKTTFSEEGSSSLRTIGEFFKIKGDYAKEIKKGAYKSYSFQMIPRNGRTSDALVMNMLFSLQPDGSYAKTVIIYNLTKEQRRELADGEALTGDFSFYYFNPHHEFHYTTLGNGSSEGTLCWELRCDEGEAKVVIGDFVSNATGWNIKLCDCVPKAEPYDQSHTDTNGSDGTDWIWEHGPDRGIYVPATPRNPGPMPGGGGGYSGGPGQGQGSGSGSGSGDGNDDGQDNNHQNPDDCIVVGGACNVATPVHHNPEQDDPCDDVQEQFENEDFKNKWDELIGDTDQPMETGYYESRSDDDFHPQGSDPTDPFHLYFPLSSLTKGVMHVHPDDYYLIPAGPNPTVKMHVKVIHMPSPDDVLSFLSLVKVNADDGKDPAEVYMIMIASTGNYQLRFTGDVSDINGVNLNPSEEDMENLVKSYKKSFEQDFKNDREKAFLNFLKDDIGLDGLRLYKTNDEGTTTAEVSLDQSGAVQSDDC